MAICRFLNDQQQPQYGLFQDGRICPLIDLVDDVPADGKLIQRGVSWVKSLPKPGADQWRSAPATLLPPIGAPEKVICIGLNYRDHAIETGSEIPSEPVVFSKFNTAIIGDGGTILLPRVADQVDYEAELVVVIGKQAKHVSVADAMDYVYGYTCGHDVSARDWQKGRPGGQWLLGKSFDTFAPLGPCIVMTDEVTDPSNLRVQMLLNGDVVQDSTTAQLIFDVPTLVSHLSTIMTLKEGDVIFTGTPPGVGVAKDPPVFLKDGDKCSVRIEKIGTLNSVCRNEV